MYRRVSWLQLFFLAHGSSCSCLGGLTAPRLVLRAQEGLALPTRHPALFPENSYDGPGAGWGAVGHVTALPRGEVWVSSSNPAHHQYCSVSGQCRRWGGGRRVLETGSPLCRPHLGACVWDVAFRQVEVRGKGSRQLQSSHIPDGLPGAQRRLRPAQVRRGSWALHVKVYVVWDF